MSLLDDNLQKGLLRHGEEESERPLKTSKQKVFPPSKTEGESGCFWLKIIGKYSSFSSDGLRLPLNRAWIEEPTKLGADFRRLGTV